MNVMNCRIDLALGLSAAIGTVLCPFQIYIASFLSLACDSTNHFLNFKT